MSEARRNSKMQTCCWDGIQPNSSGNAANKPPHRAGTSGTQTLEQQQHQIALETTEKAAIAFRNEFDERSMSRAMRTEIGRMVERAKAAQLNDLNDKRERLRQFLCAEEQALHIELQNFTAVQNRLEVQTRWDAMMALKQQRAEQQRQFVELKTVQKMLTNNDGVRTAFTQKQLVDSKRGQLMQMRDRAAQLEEERDRDRLWMDVMQRKCAEDDQREQTQRALERRNGVCLQAVQRQQIAERAEQLRIERSADAAAAAALNVSVDETEKTKERARCEKRIQHAADLRAQVVKQREERTRLADEAKRLEAAIVATCRSELAAEAEQRCADVRVRRDESARYRQYLQEMREQQKCDDQQLGRLIDAMNKKLLDARWKERCAASGQTKQRTLAVKAAVRDQFKEQQRIRRLECEQRLCEAMVDRQLSEQLVKEDRVKLMERMLRNLEFARELRRQADEKKQKKAYEIKEEQELLAKEMADSEANDRLVEKYAADASLGLRPTHPNTCLLRNVLEMD